jgi:hypothetical protein
LIPATNLVGLVFTGMEHPLQQFLAILIVAGLIEESRSARAPNYLWAAIYLIPLVRYDSLALAVPALLYLALRRHRGIPFLTGALLLATLGAFSYFLKSHGLGYLPTSVLAKSDLMRTSGSLHALAVGLYANLVLSPQGNLLLLADAFLGATAAARQGSERGLAAVLAAALLLHLVFGRVGAYYRYEAYLWAAALLTLIHLYREPLRAALTGAGVFWRRIAALAPVAAVSMGYVFVLISTPLAANNIYDQQYQMHRFAVDFYQGPVGVNDLGLVSFHNPNYVLDFWGLGSAQAQRERFSNSSTNWMDTLSAAHGVNLMMIYDSWFPNRPRDWIALGELQLKRFRVTPSGSEVQFYSRDAESARKARTLLSDFARTLPPEVSFIPATADRNLPTASDR